MGIRVPVSTAPIARPSGALPAPASGEAFRAVSQVASQVADITTRIATARNNAEADAAVLEARGVLLDEVDRINTEVDPREAEAAFETAVATAHETLTNANLANANAPVATNSLNAFAQTQLLKVRTSARTRSIKIAQGKVLKALDAANAEYARADDVLGQNIARKTTESILAQAATDQTFPPDTLEVMRQAAVDARQVSRAAFLIDAGRAEELLEGITNGTEAIDDPQLRLRWRTAAARAVEQQTAAVAADTEATDNRNASDIVLRVAAGARAGGTEGLALVPSLQFIGENINDFELRTKLIKMANDPTGTLGIFQGITDPLTKRRLIEMDASRTLTTNAVHEAIRFDLLSVADAERFLVRAGEIQRAGGPATQEDATVRRGMEHIRIANGVFAGQDITEILSPEAQLEATRDLERYANILGALPPNEREEKKFAIADQIAREALQRRKDTLITGSATLNAVNLYLPDPSEWNAGSLRVDGSFAEAAFNANRHLQAGIIQPGQHQIIMEYIQAAWDITNTEVMLGVR